MNVAISIKRIGLYVDANVIEFRQLRSALLDNVNVAIILRTKDDGNLTQASGSYYVPRVSTIP